MLKVTYMLYIFISSSIVIWVGHLCYSNGKAYLINYFPNDIHFGNGINKLLRTAYYLLNIGLAIWSLHSLREIETIEESIIEISNRLSYVLLIIAQLHIINLYTVYLIHKHFKNKIQ